MVRSKMAREMLCFTMETAAVGCKVGSAKRRVRAMFALCSGSVEGVRIGTVVHGHAVEICAAYYWGMQLQIARRLITVA